MGYLLNYARGYLAGLADAVTQPVLSGGGVQRTTPQTETVTSDVTVNFSLTRPVGSSATLTAASGTSTSFTEDVDGYYEVTGTHSSGGVAQTGFSVARAPPTFSGNDAIIDLTALLIESDQSGSAWAVTAPDGTAVTPSSSNATSVGWTPTQCGQYPFAQTVGGKTYRGSVLVGALGRWRRKTLSFDGVTHDFKTQGATVSVGGVTLTATNATNAQVMRIQNGFLEIQSNDASVLYSSSTWTAPYITFSPTELNPSFDRQKLSRLQFLVPTTLDTAASVSELYLGWQGESATHIDVVRFEGGATQNVGATQIVNAGSSASGDTAAVGKLAVIERRGEDFWCYYGTTAAYLEKGEAGQTLIRHMTHVLTASSTDFWDGGTNILIAYHTQSAGGTPNIVQISGIRLDCEV